MHVLRTAGSRKRLRVLGVFTAAAALTIAAPGAQAAVIHPASSPALSVCNWHPGNDSHDPDFSGTDLIYGSGCRGTQALWGDYVVVHCYTYSGGQKWYYLYDAANGVTGWENANSVSGLSPQAC